MALENITTTVPVGQLQSQNYTGNLMNYGMSGVDPFEFVKMVQTGEVTFDSTDPNQQALIDQYDQMARDANANNPNANLPSAAQAIGGAVVGIAGPIVANTFGNAYANTGFTDALKTTIRDPLGKNVTNFSNFDAGADTYLTGVTGADQIADSLAKLPENSATRDILNIATRKKGFDKGIVKFGSEADKYLKAPATEGSSVTNLEALKSAGVSNSKDLPSLVPQKSGSIWTDKGNIGGSLAVGGTAFVGALIAGAKPKQAAKLAVGTGLGKYLGTALFGPIGGYVGSLLGGAVGGRVICNELMRQGILDRKHVLLDYRFTRDYLTPTHVRGYHVWAVWMVKQMRKGKFVKFWKHVAGHRANEIAYIYGERDKPDYLGKVYRKILEPICWSVGLLCKKSDWSILYKTKEI